MCKLLKHPRCAEPKTEVHGIDVVKQLEAAVTDTDVDTHTSTNDSVGTCRRYELEREEG